MNKHEWWRGAVIYQIYPRSFYDSNSDGIGDIKGITLKLDYIKSLNIDAIWISPFFKSPMADFGYDVSDYKKIDSMFGTMADFDALINEAHKLDIKIIIDLVLNHTSDKHEWFSESRKDKVNSKKDWYLWADPKPDGTPPNNWLSAFGGSAWEYDNRRGQYYFHQFLKEQPDLNLRNMEVQDTLLDIMRWWLEKGVDGFRLDALNHCIHDAQLRNNPAKENIDHSKTRDRNLNPYYWQQHLYDKTQPEMIDFIKRIRSVIDEYKDRMAVAEIGDDNQNATSISYTDTLEKLHTAYNFAILGLNKCKAEEIVDVIEDYYSTEHDSWPSWAFSNHDIKRTASRWAIDGKIDNGQVKMLNALLTCIRGTSFIYEGEELGLTEADIPFEKLQDPFGKFLWPEDKGRDGCRTPMPWNNSKNAGFSGANETWLPIADEHFDMSVDIQESNFDSPLNFTRNFLAWRKKYPALKTGNMNFIKLDKDIISFTRTLDDENIFIAFNLSNKEISLNLPFDVEKIEGHGLIFSIKDKNLTLPAFGGFFGKL